MTGITTRKLGYFGNKWPTCGSLTARNGLETVTNEMKSWNALSVKLRYIKIFIYNKSLDEYFYTVFL